MMKITIIILNQSGTSLIFCDCMMADNFTFGTCAAVRSPKYQDLGVLSNNISDNGLCLHFLLLTVKPLTLADSFQCWWPAGET